MSVANVESTLSSVTQALTHLNDSLRDAGFGAGAPTYLKMADIVVGQAMWLSSQDIPDLDGDLEAVASLAAEIRGALQPYVMAMERLMAVAELPDAVDPARGVLDADARHVLEVVAGEATPVSMTWIRQRARMPSRRLRGLLDELVTAGTLTESGSSSRRLYSPARRRT